MSALERLGLGALRRLDPERAHGAALRVLRAGLAPKWDARSVGSTLRTRLWGLDFPHPVGLAAGFDKNAEAVAPLLACGFAFVEVGAVTPEPQDGNPRPRLFRLESDGAAINRFGFNNAGVEAVRARLAFRRTRGIVGVNLGANRDSPDRAADYAAVLRRLAGHADFFTVNVSSPNTKGLRDLQQGEALGALLGSALAARDAVASGTPVLLKLSPDMADGALDEAVDVALARGIDGIVATNTTLDRRGLGSAASGEAGGLSGQPLFHRSTEVLRRIAGRTGGAVQLIGVGGVGSAAQAYAKIRAGASLVQLYTALSYRGPGLVREIAEGLARRIERDGFTHVSQAVGADVRSSSSG